MKTISERLEPTLTEAEKQKAKAATKARRLGWTLNTAIGIQVVFGALTTGLGAALHGGSSSIAISILGGGSTIVATYLAKVRGSDEPELSRIRVAALDHFIRELKAFDLDHGSETGHEWDHELVRYRTDLEALLGQNSSDGQNGGGNTKDMQIWANGVRPGVPMSAFAASGYGVPPTTPGSFMSPYTATTHSVVPPYAQQLPAQHLAQNSYVGQNASYFNATPAVPGLVPHGGAQPSMFMQAGQAPGEPHFIGTPPNLARAQTATSAPWLGSRPGAAPDVARDAGHMV
ncbi:hypothetical protein PENSPDRAFT_586556 [Peniophora sp. CONT]|nr:hypothetical protein PENSPDRAFT_586556 [Peniophora sp. CONT]